MRREALRPMRDVVRVARAELGTAAGLIGAGVRRVRGARLARDQLRARRAVRGARRGRRRSARADVRLEAVARHAAARDAARSGAGRRGGDRARCLFAFAAFDVVFARLDRFPGTLWLAPEPAEPFARMIEALIERFPDCPPYGGVVQRDRSRTSPSRSREFDEAARRLGAVAAAAARAPSRAVLLEQVQTAHWREIATFDSRTRSAPRRLRNADRQPRGRHAARARGAARRRRRAVRGHAAHARPARAARHRRAAAVVPRAQRGVAHVRARCHGCRRASASRSSPMRACPACRIRARESCARRSTRASR